MQVSNTKSAYIFGTSAPALSSLMLDVSLLGVSDIVLGLSLTSFKLSHFFMVLASSFIIKLVYKASKDWFQTGNICNDPYSASFR